MTGGACASGSSIGLNTKFTGDPKKWKSGKRPKPPSTVKEVKKEKTESPNHIEVIDLTKDKEFKGQGVNSYYCNPMLRNIARYCVNKLINEYGSSIMNPRNITSAPETLTLDVDLKVQAVVYVDIQATLKHENKEVLIQAVTLDDGTFRVSFLGPDKEGLDYFNNRFHLMTRYENQYQGKLLRLSFDTFNFIPTPKGSLDSVILPDKIKKELQLNVIDFLKKDSVLTKITKKRGLLLNGPPGVGKTSSIKGLFKILKEYNVTCLSVSDDSFRQYSVELVFDMVNKYLSPCLVVFEDMDLIAMDRHVGHSQIIGPLLSALNGLEEQQEPLVVIGTTNRGDILDKAITRPCRFDRKIFIDYPNEDNLVQIFELLAKFSPPKDLFTQPANGDNKLTGAHVQEIYNTAGMLAIQRKQSVEECLGDAVDIVRENFYIAKPKIVGFSNNGVCDEEIYEPESVGYSKPSDNFQVW